MNVYQVLDTNCTGPNWACKAAAKRGRTVHVIPTRTGANQPLLVMPTYHYYTEALGEAAIEQAIQYAHTVKCDDDLMMFRKLAVPHFLPVGWVDPSRR